MNKYGIRALRITVGQNWIKKVREIKYSGLVNYTVQCLVLYNVVSLML